jgi:hypothetical protein
MALGVRLAMFQFEERTTGRRNIGEKVIEVGPSQIMEFMSLFSIEVADFGLRVTILGVNCPD